MTRPCMKTSTLAPSVDDIAAVQMARKLGLLVTLATFAALFFFCGPRWSSVVHETMRWIGAGLIFVCIMGRTWCSLYIGGRKNHELVTIGPYSVSRNPLYVFSIIGALGIGAQFGAVSVVVLAGVCAWLIHILVVRQEERLLLAEHDEVYARYLASFRASRCGRTSRCWRCSRAPSRAPSSMPAFSSPRSRWPPRSICCTTSGCCASFSPCPEPEFRAVPAHCERRTRSRCRR
jgi:protein-S-isoprenylcysteine O-methyltransferase Ste14